MGSLWNVPTDPSLEISPQEHSRSIFIIIPLECLSGSQIFLSTLGTTQPFTSAQNAYE